MNCLSKIILIGATLVCLNGCTHTDTNPDPRPPLMNNKKFIDFQPLTISAIQATNNLSESFEKPLFLVFRIN